MMLHQDGSTAPSACSGRSRSGTNLADILCVQDERVVAKDNTVHYHRQQL